MIGFNPSNIYALLYGAPTYGDSFIFPYLVNLAGAFVQILVFVHFFILPYFVLAYSLVMRIVICIFVLDILSICNCLSFLIDSQSEMNEVFNIMLCPNTSWLGVACKVVWYIISDTKGVSASIPGQGSSYYR